MKVKKLLALLLTLVMLVGLIPAIPAAAEEIVPEEEAAPTQELITVVGGDYEPDAALFDEEPQPAAPPVDAAPLPEARETDDEAEAAAPNPAIAPPAPTQAEPEEADGLEEAVRFNTPYEELPEYARQSQELIGLEETWVETWDELKAALAAPGALRIKMEENVSFKQTWNLDWEQRRYLLEVNGVKSLDLHGYTIYAVDDEVNYSTLFHITEDAYLEVYDTTHGYRPGFTEAKIGRINYDGYIPGNGDARERHLFQVDGTLILNGGFLDTGRAKKVTRYFWGFIPDGFYYLQIFGDAVRVSNTGVFIMNGGTVYGRGKTKSAVYMESNAKVYINGGTLGGFGGGNAIEKGNSAGNRLWVRNGYFFTSDSIYYVCLDGGYSDYFHTYGIIGISNYNIDNAVMTRDGLTALVTHATEATENILPLQTLKSGSPTLRVPVPARQYPEQEGLYQYGKPVDHTVDFGYEWEIQVGSEWIKAPYFTVNPEIDVFTGWEGFTPEIGQYYTARCTVHEMGFGQIFFDTIYPAVPFVVQESPRPTIYTDIPDEVSFRNNGELNLKVDAGGDDLHYIWETNAVGSPYWAMYSEDGPSVTLSSIRPSWDGLKFRCRITNSEGGETVSNVCTLRYDDGAIRSVAFTTPRYRTYGEPYVPVGGTVLETDIRCETSGVEITGVEWDTLEEPDGITSTFYGQIPHLTLSVRFSAPVADEVSVTLDGVPFDYSPYGTDNGLFSGRPYMGAYAWIMHTARGEEDAEINTVSVTPRGGTERGDAIPDLSKLRMGYRGDGDSWDVRYSIDPDETTWACDGKPVNKYTDHFLGHANYRLTAILRANEGWVFTSATTVIMEGEKCETELIDSETLKISRDYYWTDEDDDDFENHDVEVGGTDKPDNSNGDNVTGDEDNTFTFESEESKELISLVTLSGAAPVPFQTCAELSPADIGYSDGASNDKRYSVKSTRWFCEGKEMLAEDLSEGYPGNMFVLDRGYEVVSTLTPSTGYKFSAECAAKLGEADMKAERLYDGDIEVTKSWYIDETGLVLSSSESYAAPNVLHDDIGSGTGYIFGTLTINCDYNSSAPAVVNKEDGLVIYVEKDVTVRVIGGKSAFILNGDTTITGPGRLTVIVDDEGTQTTGPAAIQVNGCRLTIRDADLSVIGCTGIRGSGGASLEIDHSNIRTDTVNGGIFDFTGNMSLTDCRVTEPSLHMGSTLGILYPTSGYNPVEDVVIIPERAVQSISIGGLSAVETSLVMAGGETRQLSAIITPADAAMQEVTWSADTNNVKVSPDGLVTAYKVGNATVTATCGGMRASIGVVVTSNDVNVTSFALIPHEITVGVGQTAALRPQVLPLNASNPSGFWYVYNNDPHVALVGDTTAVDLNEATVVVRGAAPGDADVIVFSNGFADAASCTVHVVENYTPAENVTVSTGVGRSLRVGDTATLTATVTPAAATDKTVMWTSSDPDVVTVDQSGNITVAGVGEATVTAEIWNGSALVSSSVDITVPYPVLGVGISAPRNVLYVGGSVQLEAYVYPGSAENKAVTWTSSNEAVATVDTNGVVTAVGTDNESSSDSVTITCTTADGGYSDSVSITVNQPPTRVQSLTLSQNELTMPVSGDKSSQRIYIKILPENADETAWTCTVSSPLATASIVHLEDADHNFISGTEPLYGEYCYVVADLTGTANLTFRSVDGGRTARLRVNVIEAEDYVPVTSVEIEEFITLGIGQSMSILPTITPANASEKTVFLATNDREGTYIRVEDGRVYGVSEGYANIDVTVDGVSTRANGLPATCNIHVVKPVEILTLDAQVVALPLGGTQRLIATVGPDDAYDKTVTWTSADESVVTVDPDGTLHAVGYGTTYITAETAVYPLSTGCSVTVISNAYELYIDGTQITDENRVGDSYTYDPSANILTVSGGIGSEGGAPAIRSEIDGLTVAFTGEPSLSAAQSALWLEADTTVTGAATLRSTGAVPVYVTNGASLTLDGADLTVIGPSGIHATGTGESLAVINAGLSVSGIVEALGGFDGGITLTGSVLLGGLSIENGAVSGATALEIIPAPAYGTPDFTLPATIRTIEDGAFEGIDAEIVYIPDGCTSIGRGAFRSCESLTQIRVPAGCAIGEGAFEGCGTVYVFAPAGSPAQTFCENPANPNCIFIAE